MGAKKLDAAKPVGSNPVMPLLVKTVPGAARRCRAGMVFGEEAVTIDGAELSDEALQALYEDERLVVTDADQAG